MRNYSLVIMVSILLSMTTLGLNAADIEDGLWMYLPLNEGRGDQVVDYGPHNFETEFSAAAPKWVDAGHEKITDGLEFDGKSNFIRIDMESQGNDIDSHFDGDKGLSICAWVKVLDTGTDGHGQTRQPIVMKGNGGAGWEFSLLIYDSFGSGFSVWTCPGGGVSEPNIEGTASQNTWVHHCATFLLTEGSRVYINGDPDPVAQAGDNGAGVCESGTAPVFIAHREDGQYLNAVIAEVFMWDRVIDDDEMNLAMNSIGGLPVQPGGKLTTTWGNVKQR